MATASNLGFPRIGANRELKTYLENYWNGHANDETFYEHTSKLRIKHWKLQKSAGIQHIPSYDAPYYDHVLDVLELFSLIPFRFRHLDGLTQYFAMARGLSTSVEQIPAMEMTKWFDTNYHHITPEFEKDMHPQLNHNKVKERYLEALQYDIQTRPVIVGPLTLFQLGKSYESIDHSLFLQQLIEAYHELLNELAAIHIPWIQIDEPIFPLNQQDDFYDMAEKTYTLLSKNSPKILFTTYFSQLNKNALACLKSLPCHGIHLDCVRGDYTPDTIASLAKEKEAISLGVVNGRNIWRADLKHILSYLTICSEKLDHEKLMIAPSCSLLHVPVDASLEEKIDPHLHTWLAYAVEKLGEVRILTKALSEGSASVNTALSENQHILQDKRQHPDLHKKELRARMANIKKEDTIRQTSFRERRTLQQKKLKLPLFPCTTIGSFPQTKEIRRVRSDFRKRKIPAHEYEQIIQKETTKVINFQEDLGMNVLVHGESERNDMVEYFGEQLEGFFSTQHGWVQSYGSRCVKPPVIFADIMRPTPMTVKWISYAQSLTELPVKGMLTGPTTIMQWSFVRDDIPRSEVARQLALAIRDEIYDLEKAGISIIQVDEPAFREALPLQRSQWNEYIQWSTECFRLATSGVADDTQIHTHMCYSEFNDFIEAITKLDADVISIESSRSGMELLKAFTTVAYPNAIGPGIYDIHSPNIPDQEHMYRLLKDALRVLDKEQLWVNPDCGLKTRKWKEVRPSLQNMVAAAQQLREEYM
ncbi:hypothetical protein LSH36_793g00044 [Paralvinella palmiformis]|uniref:5-methyltetrahydropteroyltriglutamate--homocysteine S-methyltransferase n=1 Tax=Paralvinella palmiformis TaxID=53620 RepID=A0AAD9J1P6_9ANNE|nr:hypothetical protein LSH36_793g00044 [Paralvinella palmiformis]